jgi:hypothetical protein
VSAEGSDLSPRDRGQIRLMREAGLSIHDIALYFGTADAAVYRALQELRAQFGPEKGRDGPVSAEEVRAERRLSLYRENCPKRIAEDMGVHINTVSKVNLGLHPVQARIADSRYPATHNEKFLDSRSVFKSLS